MKKKHRSICLGLILIASLGIISCEKDGGKPTIELTDSPGFLAHDTVLMVGDSVQVGIEVAWNGVNNLNKLDIFLNEQLVNSTEMEFNQAQPQITIVKGFSDSETWTFSVTDTKKNTAELSLVLEKDPNSVFGPLKYYAHIVLGAQANISVPGFLGINTGELFNLDGAYMNPASVDLVFYFDDGDQAVLTSPGANIPGYVFDGDHNLENWTVKNTTLFQLSNLTTDQFGRIFHDGSISANFDEGEAKRKAKNLAPGQVITFKTESGLLGLIHIVEVEAGVDGSITFQVKVQDM